MCFGLTYNYNVQVFYVSKILVARNKTIDCLEKKTMMSTNIIKPVEH